MRGSDRRFAIGPCFTDLESDILDFSNFLRQAMELCYQVKFSESNLSIIQSFSENYIHGGVVTTECNGSESF